MCLFQGSHSQDVSIGLGNGLFNEATGHYLNQLISAYIFPLPGFNLFKEEEMVIDLDPLLIQCHAEPVLIQQLI